MKRIAILLALMCCLGFTGCGAVASLAVNRDLAPKDQTYVYSGVRMNCQYIAGRNANNTSFGMKCFFFVDLPFSAAADTICLPYTITKAISAKEEASNNAVEAMR